MKHAYSYALVSALLALVIISFVSADDPTPTQIRGDGTNQAVEDQKQQYGGGYGGGDGGWGGRGGGGGWGGSGGGYGGGGGGWGGGGGGWGRGGGGWGGGHCRWGNCCGRNYYGGGGGYCRCCYNAQEALAFMQTEARP